MPSLRMLSPRMPGRHDGDNGRNSMKADPRRRDLARYPWQVTLETRFADMDFNHHLNNVAVARLYEEARVRFNSNLWRAHPKIERPFYFVGHVAIDYLGEGHYPAPVTIGYGIGSIGTKSHRVTMGMFQNGVCIGLSDTVMVFRGPDGPAAIPGTLREILEGWMLRV